MTDRHSNDTSVRLGDVLDDRYELREILGYGGISTVYMALDRYRSQPNEKEHYVTVKVIKRQYLTTEERMVALAQASRTCKSLNHPNIVKTQGLYRDGDTAYLVMEYLSGESLGQRISTGRVPVRKALWIVNEIGRALTYAHAQGLVHNDLKPANVFLTHSGDVKVIDFGIAHTLRQSAKGDNDTLHFGPDDFSVSTPSYASPELLEQRETDPRDDIYALACIAYELLSSRHPFGRVRATGARKHGLEPRTSAAFTKNQWSCLRKALAFNREERPPTVAEFLAGLNTSTNWTRRLAVAAGIIACGVTVSLYYGQSQMPLIEWSTEPEPTITPNLVPSTATNQRVISEESRPQPSAAAELVTEVQVPNDEKDIRGRIEISRDSNQKTETQRLESVQPARISEQSSPQDDEISPAAIDTGPEIPTGDEPTLAKPPVGAVESPTAQPQQRPSQIAEFASVTEIQEPLSAAEKLPSSAETRSPSASDLSPKEVSHAAIERQSRDEDLPKRKVAKRVDLAKPKTTKDTVTRIVAVKHDLISHRESPVAAIRTRILGPVSKATVSIDTGEGFVPHKLHDDGTHGDQVSGDREYYAAVGLGKHRGDIRYYITAYTPKGAAVSNPPGAQKAPYQIALPGGSSRTAVVINEFMSSNSQTLADAQGGYDDWIELYNPTRETIDLSGRYLSDSPKKPKQWRFPDGTKIGAKSYLIVWADRSSSYTNMSSQPPDLHTNFKLSRRGDQILLVDSDENGNAIIDRVSFGRQREDWSMARYPNGSGEFRITAAPTPGRGNRRPR